MIDDLVCIEEPKSRIELWGRVLDWNYGALQVVVLSNCGEFIKRGELLLVAKECIKEQYHGEIH